MQILIVYRFLFSYPLHFHSATLTHSDGGNFVLPGFHFISNLRHISLKLLVVRLVVSLYHVQTVNFVVAVHDSADTVVNHASTKLPDLDICRHCIILRVASNWHKLTILYLHAIDVMLPQVLRMEHWHTQY